MTYTQRQDQNRDEEQWDQNKKVKKPEPASNDNEKPN